MLATVSDFLWSYILIVMLVAGVDILPLTLDTLPLDLYTNSEYLKGEAWLQRDETNDVIIDVSSLCFLYIVHLICLFQD